MYAHVKKKYILKRTCTRNLFKHVEKSVKYVCVARSEICAFIMQFVKK